MIRSSKRGGMTASPFRTSRSDQNRHHDRFADRMSGIARLVLLLIYAAHDRSRTANFFSSTSSFSMIPVYSSSFMGSMAAPKNPCFLISIALSAT